MTKILIKIVIIILCFILLISCDHKTNVIPNSSNVISSNETSAKDQSTFVSTNNINNPSATSNVSTENSVLAYDIANKLELDKTPESNIIIGWEFINYTVDDNPYTDVK